ncbi:unnamed protein product [Nyctereutes procyonoides]|uniref:(raccoon dog) hypothetical protein n=1 Tax=Nyctereutes procyonoides TaxID=34880 RepID=A0A811Y9D1_NYCPR|nr:unnamed protein product [Nyctereutes procyonoides]
MAWTAVLFVLLCHCTGSLSQPVLTQPPSLSESLGTTARLTSILSSQFGFDSYVINCFQQNPGSPPQYHLYYYLDSSTQLVSEVPSCFSGSKDKAMPTPSRPISGWV